MIELIAGLLALALAATLYVKWSHNYWTRRNVPQIETSSIFGNVEGPGRVNNGLMMSVKSCYDEFKRRGAKHGGMYMLTTPIYVPIDIDLIKGILAKDFPHFLGRGIVFNEKLDPLALHLFNLEGEKWRNMRVQLTPTFTSGKMKMMFQTLIDCGGPLMEHVGKVCANGELLDVKEVLACYTTDVIGSCAFGLECNSFKDPNAEFRKCGRQIFEPRLMNIVFQFLLIACPSGVVKRLPLKRVPVNLEQFFINAIRNVMDYRTVNSVKRNDFIQLFMEIQEKAKMNGTKGMTVTEISAQAFVFFIAGFETSSTTMTFCLHELAHNQEIQDKLREEIREAFKKNGGKLTYDAIMEMKYMDKVLNETLRKYPPLSILTRVCSLDYNIPGTDVTLKKGTKVFISSLGIQRDEEYYPDPDKFDPERFSEEAKATRPNFAFLPFGEGPRICIGLRFGLMQAKTGLSILLRNYKVLPQLNGSYTIPFDPKSFILTKKGKVMLNVVELSN